jgi:4-amino-4-deoxy-L-arabinose transferase-like glycosyltransferase
MVSTVAPLQKPASAAFTNRYSRQTWWQDLLVLTLAFIILFGAFLGSRPLTVPDEGRYAEIPREMLSTGDYVTPRINGVKYFEKPPFFYWMQTASYHALGINEWAIRLPNALMALLGVLMVYGTARTLYTRRTGLLAAATLGTFGLYSAMAHMVTLDMTLSTLVTATFCCFLLGNQYPAGPRRNRFMWAMYFFAALATLTKGMMGIAFPCMVIFTWILFTAQWREIKTYCLPTGFLLLTAITLPWHILAQIKNPEFFKYYIVDQQILRYLTDAEKRSQPFWFLPSVLFGGLFPWTGFMLPAILSVLPTRWRRESNHKHPETSSRATINNVLMAKHTITDPINLFLLLWAGLIFLFFWFSNSQLMPYVLPIYPPLAIILGQYFDWALDHRHHWGIRFGFASMTVMAIALLIVGGLLLELSQPTLKITIGLLGGTVIISLLNYWRSTLLRALITLGLTTSLFFISFNFSYPPMDTRSIKTLATTLKPLLKENDMVYSYQNHYQDLPVYLGRRVIMTEFYGELWHGLEHTNHQGIWMTNNELWGHWSKPVRQFMIMSLSDYRVVQDQHPDSLYEIKRDERNILVSNFSTGESE